jgi:hypothetical protein
MIKGPGERNHALVGVKTFLARLIRQTTAERLASVV